MGWAFWRSWARKQRADDAPLPADVGLPASPRRPAAGTPGGDRDPADAAQPAASPFSGASPGAPGAAPRRAVELGLSADGPTFDRAARQRHGRTVAAVVRAVLAGDRDRLDETIAGLERADVGGASDLAAAALAARLPGLSGVAGDVVFDEPADDLLHAYADLLAERAEPLRRRVAPDSRDAVARVAHVAAAAAHEQHLEQHESHEAGAQRLVLPGTEPQQQLVAAGVLLAQTTRDGGGDVDALGSELAALADRPRSG